MFGLIKKDLLLINKNLKTFILILLAYGLIALGGSFDITFIIPFVTVMLFISTFSYDDFNNWNSYAITLPSGRKNVVKAKYATGLIIAVISIIITFIMILAISLVNKQPIDITNIISELVGVSLAVVILFSLMCPLIFKFGTEKGRIWVFILVFGFVSIVSICSRIIDLNEVGKSFKIVDDLWYISVPIIFIGSILISYIASKNIYLKKEF